MEDLPTNCVMDVGYAKIFGFDDSEVLHERGYLKELHRVIGDEIKVLEHNARQVWGAVYQGRFKEMSSGGDLQHDLAEEKITPVLKEISQAGFDYLDRAYTAYTHALDLVGSDDKLLMQVADLGAEISEVENRLAGSLAGKN